MPYNRAAPDGGRRSYNMMVRLSDVERGRLEKCLERFNRQRVLDGMIVLRSQSDFVRFALDNLCSAIEGQA